MIFNKPVGISSVEFRDGQQSLLATRLKTEDMLPILKKMDNVGYNCIEMWGGATFDVCIRYLEEDPWERVRKFKKIVTRTPLRMLLRGQNLLGYQHYPDDIVERFVAKAAEAGIDIFLIFDILDDLRNCETAIRAVHKAGKTVEGNIQYTISPVHNTEQYIKTAKWFENMGASAVHLEDMAGMLTPDIAFQLIKALKESVKVPVHIHCHSTGGMADLAYWKAIEAGVDVIDTDISALSRGTAHPPTECFVVALRDTARDTKFDLDLLMEINAHFLMLREKYKEFESRFTGVDISVLQHQIPGGMLSNLESQLKELASSDKLDQVLQEVHMVRKDLGYPPLGTPLSQMVGAQAAMNVIMGERYKMIPAEVKNYIKGMYGNSPGPINAELEERVLGSEKKLTCRPGELLEDGFAKLSAEIGSLAHTEEDVLTYAMFPEIAKPFLKKKYQ